METIFGEGWRLEYIIENGKLVGMKYSGTAKNMKGAFNKLKEMIKVV